LLEALEDLGDEDIFREWHGRALTYLTGPPQANRCARRSHHGTASKTRFNGRDKRLSRPEIYRRAGRTCAAPESVNYYPPAGPRGSTGRSARRRAGRHPPRDPVPRRLGTAHACDDPLLLRFVRGICLLVWRLLRQVLFSPLVVFRRSSRPVTFACARLLACMRWN
jgi:hypothetical protein